MRTRIITLFTSLLLTGCTLCAEEVQPTPKPTPDATPPGEKTTWTDASGKRVAARYEGHDATHLSLSSGGLVKLLPRTALSQEDNAYLDALSARAVQPGDAPQGAPTESVASSPPAHAAGLQRVGLRAATGLRGKEVARDQMDYGSFDETTVRRTNIEISVSNKGPAGRGILAWYFVGVDARRAYRVASGGRREISLAEMETLTMRTATATVAERAWNYTLIRYAGYEGLKYYGWMVQVLSPDGQSVLASEANQGPLKELAAKPVSPQ